MFLREMNFLRVNAYEWIELKEMEEVESQTLFFSIWTMDLNVWEKKGIISTKEVSFSTPRRDVIRK